VPAVLITIIALASRSVCAQIPSPDTAAKTIRLADAVGAAERNSPTSVQAHGQIGTAVTEERAAYASFLPNVSVGVNNSFSNQGSTASSGGVLTGANGNPIVTGGSGSSAAYRSTGTLSASMTLFDWGSRIYSLDAARSDLAAAEAGSQASTYNVALQVVQAFYNALAAREALAAAQTELALADSTQRIANSQLRVRLVTLSDSLKAAIQSATARVAIATAVTNLSSANVTLSRLVASPVLVTADPADSIIIGGALPDSASLLQLAETGPTVQQAAATQSASTDEERSARAAFLPELDATYSFTGNGQNAYLGVGQSYTYGNRIGLSVSVPILDSYQRAAALERAEIAAVNAGASARDAKLGARQTLVQAMGTVQLAQERIREQSASITAALEDIRVNLDRYRIGEATIVDVLTSENELTTAQSALVQARYDYRVARAQIEAVVGRPL
jgi:outer membrane protein